MEAENFEPCHVQNEEHKLPITIATPTNKFDKPSTKVCINV